MLTEFFTDTPDGGLELLGADFCVGGDAPITDQKTVVDVQRKLHSLAIVQKDAALGPYKDKYRDDGVLGTRTKQAVAAFNARFGWPDDGENITAGTLEALKRSDIWRGGYGPSSEAVPELPRSAPPSEPAPSDPIPPLRALIPAPGSPDTAPPAPGVSNRPAIRRVPHDDPRNDPVIDAAMALGGAVGIALFGVGGALLWPAHRILGFLLVGLLVGSPLGAAVGNAVATAKLES